MLLISSASSPSFRSSSAISGCTTAGAAGATGGAGAGAGFGTAAAARGSLAAGRVSACGGSSISVSTRWLSCVVTARIRWLNSPASCAASDDAASRIACALLAYV